MIQLINRNITGTNTDDTPYSDGTSGHSCVDQTIPYATATPLPAGGSATWSALDAPGLDLAPLKQVEMSDAFDDYFMYKPSDVPPGVSIWATLARLSWSYDMSTSLSGTVWAAPTINSQSTPSPASAYTDLPRWACLHLNS
jgi:hypothetical protein